MEQMITSADFMHTEDDHALQRFTSSIEDWISGNADDITVREVQASMKAVQGKVCRPDFPSEGTSGYNMGYNLIGALQGVISDLIDEEKARPTDFHQIYLEFILQMIETGPGTSHVEYIFMLKDDDAVEFQAYFQDLRGDVLSRVTRCLKKEYRPDPGTDWKAYSSAFDKFYRHFIADYFSEEQFEVAHEDFLNLFMFLRLGFNDKDIETRTAMNEFAYRIELIYDRTIFKGIQGRVLAQKLQELSEIILAPEFPQEEDVAKEVKDILGDLLRTVSEDGLIGSMYDVIMDLALNLTVRKAGCEETREYFETIGYFFYHISENCVKNNGDLFEGLVKKFMYVLDHVKDEVYLTYRFVNSIMDNCLGKAMGTSEDEVRQWIAMIKAMLRHSVPECIESAHRAMKEKDKLLKWKKYPEDIKEIFSLLSAITFPKWLTEEQYQRGMNALKNLSSDFLDEAKKAGIAKLELTGPMMEFVFHCLEMLTPQAYSLAKTVVEKIEFNPKRDKALLMDALRRVTAIFEDDRYEWDDEESGDLGSAVQEIVSTSLDCVKDGKAFTWEEYDDLIYLAKISQTKMNTATENTTSVFCPVYSTVAVNISGWLTTMNESHRLIPLIPGMIEAMENDDDMIREIGSSQLAMISQSAGNLCAQYLSKLIQHFLESENDIILSE
ncbi:hypothetical protein V1264_002240 [Littorina saxatilis]|uniref:Uncharacterized protein n=1 Tax=Littorina saxatilis TaxID=31220 RepID=A0AAN9C3J7_9CAEN